MHEVSSWVSQPLTCRRDLFEQALAIYRNQSYYKAERARVLHWKAKTSSQEEASKLDSEAAQLLGEARQEWNGTGESFLDSDYDDMVVFWSR